MTYITVPYWFKRLHKQSATTLFVISIVASLAILKFQNLPKMQFQILVILSLIYLSWALLHHTLDKSLTLEIVIEYVLTALLALIILYGLLL